MDYTKDVEPHVAGLVDKMRQEGWRLVLKPEISEDPKMWKAVFYRPDDRREHSGVSQNQAVAICLAALAVRGVLVGYINKGEYVPPEMT